MKNLFLASEIDVVAQNIAGKIGKNKVRRSKTVFINTAAETHESNPKWLQENRKGLIKTGFNLFDYTITGKTLVQINKDLASVDIIHVNGGDVFYLLYQVKKSRFDKFVKKAIDQGRIYMGSSAGSVVVGPDIRPLRKTENKICEKKLKSYKGINLVDFVILPHWGRKDYHQDLYLNFRLSHIYNEKHKLILLNDKQYVWVKDDWYKIMGL